MSGFLSNDDGEKGWDEWDKEIKKQYPIQWFFREWLMGWDNPVYSFLKIRSMRLNDQWWNIKRFIKPCCPRWRKSFPRHTYSDITNVLAQSNFALILDFWYVEAQPEITQVNWNSDKEHKEFYAWLKKAVKYVEVGRPQLQQKASDALHEASIKKGKLSYEARYGKTNKLDAKIKEKDTELLVELMKRRDFFWT